MIEVEHLQLLVSLRILVTNKIICRFCYNLHRLSAFLLITFIEVAEAMKNMRCRSFYPSFSEIWRPTNAIGKFSKAVNDSLHQCSTKCRNTRNIIQQLCSNNVKKHKLLRVTSIKCRFLSIGKGKQITLSLLFKRAIKPLEKYGRANFWRNLLLRLCIEGCRFLM